MRQELSVVIPTYNERENLKILIPKILDVFKKRQWDGEIIIVDDKSGDGSFEFLNEQVKLIPELRVIFRDPPRSLSRAWFEGFSAARKKNIVAMDADLCYDPEYLTLMMEKMNNFDVVIGSRYINNRFSIMNGKPVISSYISILGQFIARIATGLEVCDTSSGFRMFKKKTFDAIRGDLKNRRETKGNTWLIKFLYYAKNSGARITEIPIKYGERIHGATKLRVLREGFRYLGFVSEAFIETHFKFFKTVALIGLTAMLLFSLAKLQANIKRFGNDGGQRDFSVYYTAGESLLRDFPLYKNGIAENPPIWDGSAIYTYSRFIYPPLMAVPFAFIANTMTFATAKFFWIYFSLICILLSTAIVIRRLKLQLKFWQYAIMGIYASWFFPLQTFIALGQIDAFSLLIAIIAIGLATSDRRHEIASGFFWAFATLTKLHIGMVVLFFIIRKQWKILKGYILGGVTIIILTILFLGSSVLSNYLTNDLPRFVQIGSEIGPPEMKLPDTVFDKYYAEYGQGHDWGFVKNGRWFGDVKISFSPNASLSRFLNMRIKDIDHNLDVSPMRISLTILAILLPLAFVGLRKIKTKNPELSSGREFLYWYSILVILLLLGPLTWTMNVIWLIPLSALAIGRTPWSSTKIDIIPWLVLVFALLLAALPDCMFLALRDFANPSWGCKIMDSKYVLAEVLILISLWLQIGKELLSKLTTDLQRRR